jgi:hypothetical protein
MSQTEYCKKCGLFQMSAIVNDIPLCSTCLNDCIDPDEKSALECMIDNLEDEVEYLGSELRIAVDERAGVCFKIEQLKKKINEIQGFVNITINEQTVIDVVGCSKDTAKTFLENKNVQRLLRGQLSLVADDRIDRLFNEWKREEL